MIWAGDLYCQISGDYRIDVSYSSAGEFCKVRCGPKIIGYTDDTDKAKEMAEAHLSEVTA